MGHRKNISEPKQGSDRYRTPQTSPGIQKELDLWQDLKVAESAAGEPQFATMTEMSLGLIPPSTPLPPASKSDALKVLLEDGITWGDSSEWLPAVPPETVDLWFTSPPYADARAYSRIHPDRYVDWFLPYSKAMFEATKPTGWFILNIKNRVAKSGPLTASATPTSTN